MRPEFLFLCSNPEEQEVWRSVLKKVQKNMNRLTNEEAENIFKLLVQKISNEEEDKEKQLDYLDYMSKLVQSDEEFKKVISASDMETLSKSLSLNRFICDSRQHIWMAGTDLYSDLLELDPVYNMGEEFPLRGNIANENAQRIIQTLIKQRNNLNTQKKIRKKSLREMLNRMASNSKFDFPQQMLNNSIDEEEEIIDLICSDESEDIVTKLPGLIQEKFMIHIALENVSRLQKGQLTKEEAMKEIERTLSFLTNNQKNSFLEFKERSENLLKKTENTGVHETFKSILSLQEDKLSSTMKMFQTLSENLYDLDTLQETINIHYQFISILSSELSICFIGLLKAGKSSLINSILGFDVAPTMKETITSIPVRYLHTPFSNNLVLMIPFWKELTEAIQYIKQSAYIELVNQRMQLTTIHLQGLFMSIKNGDLCGFQEKYVYEIQGTTKEEKFQSYMSLITELNKVCFQVHQIFRLCAYEVNLVGSEIEKEQIFPEAFDVLPNKWKYGLDHLMTVCMNFESLGDSSMSKFSLIDTPGIDEANVRKLNMQQSLYDIVELSHVTCLVIEPQTFHSTGLEPTRNYLASLKKKYKVPLLVCATRKDQLQEKEANDLRGSVSHTFHMHLSDIFVTSPEFNLVSKLMGRFIRHCGRKPKHTAEWIHEKDLALRWIKLFAEGFNFEDKKRNYALQSDVEILNSLSENINESSMTRMIEKVEVLSTEMGLRISISVAYTRAQQSLKEIIKRYTHQIMRVESKSTIIKKNEELIEELNKMDEEAVELRGECKRFVQFTFHMFQDLPTIAAKLFCGHPLELLDEEWISFFKPMVQQMSMAEGPSKYFVKGNSYTFENPIMASQGIRSTLILVDKNLKEILNKNLKKSSQSIIQAIQKTEKMITKYKDFIGTKCKQGELAKRLPEFVTDLSTTELSFENEMVEKFMTGILPNRQRNFLNNILHWFMNSPDNSTTILGKNIGVLVKEVCRNTLEITKKHLIESIFDPLLNQVGEISQEMMEILLKEKTDAEKSSQEIHQIEQIIQKLSQFPH